MTSGERCTGLSRLGVDAETAEMVIGHLPQGIRRVYDLYDRLDERRQALERWEDHVMAAARRSADDLAVAA